jgi:hypothetical protein
MAGCEDVLTRPSSMDVYLGVGTSDRPQRTPSRLTLAASYMPRKTAPPSEIHIVRGTTPEKSALGPSVRAISDMRAGIERKDEPKREAVVDWPLVCEGHETGDVIRARSRALRYQRRVRSAGRTSSMTRVLMTSKGVVEAAAMAPATEPQMAASWGSTLRSR